MSEVNKDVRLAELMTEFLESSHSDDEKKDADLGQGTFVNKKVLAALEDYRLEIEKLKEKVDQVNQKLQDKNTVEEDKNYKKNASEINDLQSSISNHSAQIGDLLYKQQLLKTDLERKKKPSKKTTFGSLGWLLLLSNLLLWSLLAFYFWNQDGSNRLDSTATVAENKTTKKRSEAIQKNGIADTLAEAAAMGVNINKTDTAGIVLNNTEPKNEGQQQNKINPQPKQQFETVATIPPIAKSLAAKQTNKPLNSSIKETKPVASTPRVQSSFSKPTVTSIARPLKKEEALPVAKKKSAVDASKIEKLKPVAKEPDVTFGD